MASAFDEKMILAIQLILAAIFLGTLFANAFFAFAAINERKEGIKLFSKEWGRNPCNMLWMYPEYLNEKGKEYRKKHFICLGTAMGSLFLGTVISILNPL